MTLYLVERDDDIINLDEFIMAVVLASTEDEAIDLVMNAATDTRNGSRDTDYCGNTILGDWEPVREHLIAKPIPTDIPNVVLTYSTGY